MLSHTPDLFRSVTKETPFNSSAVSSFRDREGCSSLALNLSNSFDFREDPSFWKDHNVQVIIRVRPLSNSEIAVQGPNRCVKQESSQTITWTGPPEARFTFDHVADEHVSQEMLFKVAGVPMVENCMGGYNSCMFAYGQTGSGKTHTMLGDIDGGSRRHSVNAGMTPRVFEYLFSRIQKDREARREEKIQFTCKCSFLEIYNEQILDLLDPSSANLQIREDTKKGVYVDNLTEIEVSSARDVIQQLLQGAANRKVASTNMNRASSRSHSVFTCIIESKWVSQGVTHHRFSRLNLVDLAGSERQKSSGAEGERLKEATNINKSLSTLGLVIMNLVNVSNGKSLHVPYRDSKLTFLLQDSLGGNSKTTIIANISPSSCCSLETLSTLKFAQRAKFIKNHATINEDASGDVLAMRMQIQHLKKEVSRLQNVISGGAENNDDCAWALMFPGSPGSFKWEGIDGSFSPVTAVKKMSQKKEYEIALVGAFRREKDKDITLQSLSAESQAAKQLAKQREDEIQGLKMRLRFREAAIKRLEAVASGKISAETHLLKEKEEHLKELEVLRTQVDRNQEVTRFAMENLRLTEEIRRLKSFYEEGEKERMNEQIAILEDKLLEALDWKLMHESQPAFETNNSDLRMDGQRDGGLFNLSPLKDPITPYRKEKPQLEFPSLGDQRELQTMVDAIAAASQREAQAHETAIILAKENEELRMKVKMVIDDNNKLIELYERAVADSQSQTSSRAEESQKDHDTLTAFAQKELEIKKEKENLEHQLMEMHEENERLLGLYEKVMLERNELKSQKELEMKNVQESLEQQLMEMNEENEKLLGLYEKAMLERDELKSRMDHDTFTTFAEKEAEMEREKESLENRLMEIQESNEKLLGLYEKATQERDELKSQKDHDNFSLFAQKEAEMEKEKESLAQKLMELHKENEKLLGLYEKAVQETNELKSQKENNNITPFAQKEIEMKQENESLEQKLVEMHEENEKLLGLYEKAMQERDELKTLLLKNPDGEIDCVELFPSHDHLAKETQFENLAYDSHDASNLVEVPVSIQCSSPRTHKFLDSDETRTTSMEVTYVDDSETKSCNNVHDLRIKLDKALETLSESTHNMNLFESLERGIFDIDRLSHDIEAAEETVQMKQKEYASSNLLISDLKERENSVNRKLTALRYSLANFSSSLDYFKLREVQARVRTNESSSHLKSKRKQLSRLQAIKDEIEGTLSKNKKSEAELKNEIATLKLKVEEENKRRETDKVLIAIDNVESTEIQRNWQLGGKATELLKSEEEKTKLQMQMKQDKQRLESIIKEAEKLNRKLGEVEQEMEATQVEIQKGIKIMEEMEHKLHSIIQEKEMVMEMKETGMSEFENLLFDFLQSAFEAQLKEEELKILGEEMDVELKTREEVQAQRRMAVQKMSHVLEGTKGSLSHKLVEDLQHICSSLLELKSVLGEC